MGEAPRKRDGHLRVTGRVVLLTGAPGSGKSTLGRALAHRMYLPFVARDDVRRGLLHSALGRHETPNELPGREDATEVFLRIVESLLAADVSCIAEYVVRREQPDDLTRLSAAGDLVVVMTRCAHPLRRAAERDRADPFMADPAVLAAAGHTSVDALLATSLDHMRRVERSMRTEFPAPTLVVDTDGTPGDGGRAQLEEVVDFVTMGGTCA